MHVAQWLTDLGLSQYVGALTANGFEDGVTIRTLTEGDLIQCGVDNLDHRRRMLMSVQAMSALQQSKTIESSSSCSCSCKPNCCGYLTVAMIIVGLVVGVVLLALGVTTSCVGNVEAVNSCVRSRLLEEVFGCILMVVGLVCTVVIWCPCLHRIAIGRAERSRALGVVGLV